MTALGYDAAFDDPADHMRGTLELIAGHKCAIKPIARLGRDGTYFEHLHDVVGDRDGWKSARFDPDTCPVCMARKCLEQIDAQGVPGSTESAACQVVAEATAPGPAELVAPDPSPVGSEHSEVAR